MSARDSYRRHSGHHRKSGSGKSTLMHVNEWPVIHCGRGRITAKAYMVWKAKQLMPFRSREMAFIFRPFRWSQSNLLPKRHAASWNSRTGQRNRRNRVEEALKSVGLEKKINTSLVNFRRRKTAPGHCSSHIQQPKIIFAERTNCNLDQLTDTHHKYVVGLNIKLWACTLVVVRTTRISWQVPVTGRNERRPNR